MTYIFMNEIINGNEVIYKPTVLALMLTISKVFSFYNVHTFGLILLLTSLNLNSLFVVVVCDQLLFGSELKTCMHVVKARI